MPGEGGILPWHRPPGVCRDRRVDRTPGLREPPSGVAQAPGSREPATTAEDRPLLLLWTRRVRARRCGGRGWRRHPHRLAGIGDGPIAQRGRLGDRWFGGAGDRAVGAVTPYRIDTARRWGQPPPSRRERRVAPRASPRSSPAPTAHVDQNPGEGHLARRADHVRASDPPPPATCIGGAGQATSPAHECGLAEEIGRRVPRRPGWPRRAGGIQVRPPARDGGRAIERRSAGDG